MLVGLTTKPVNELLPLAKSWISPPKIETSSGGFRVKGYDPGQMSFVVIRESSSTSSVELTLQGSEASPIVNPAIVVENWSDEDVRLSLDGKPVTRGKEFRLGRVQGPDRTDLVVWIQTQSTKALHIKIGPAGGK